jgi:hypothetical protein
MVERTQFEVRWSPREVPLLPIAAAAQGHAALALARRLLQEADEHLCRLEGLAGQQLIVIQGASDLLPWVDGIQYLGFESSAPALLLPTNYRPSVPPALLAGALAANSDMQGVIALLPHPLVLVPMWSARPIARGTLASWLERQ